MYFYLPMPYYKTLTTLTTRTARIAFTLIVAVAAAALCVQWRTPLPWMIGPLVAISVLSMLGAPTGSYTPLRNVGQWVIGTALGLYFTPPVVALVLGLWWAMALNVVWALALGVAFGSWLYRVHRGPGVFHITGLSRATCYFASPIGGASEMTLMAERRGAQTELVASSHSLRVLLVTLIIPFSFQFAGLHGLDITAPGPRVVNASGLAALGVLTGAACWLMVKLKLTNPWFLGALAASLAITASGQTWSAIPIWMTNAAQLVIGISLGVRFTRSFVHLAPRWLASVALGTLAMIGLCAGFAAVVAWATELRWATVLLGTSPGGIAEMAITAKVLQLGVPLVTAFHVTRLAAVLLLAEPIYRWLQPGSANTF